MRNRVGHLGGRQDRFLAYKAAGLNEPNYAAHLATSILMATVMFQKELSSVATSDYPFLNYVTEETRHGSIPLHTFSYIASWSPYHLL